MHSLKWWKTSTRMFFDNGSEAGGGAGSASSTPSPAPSGGDGGGSSSASPGGGGGTTPSPSPSPDPGPSASPSPSPSPGADNEVDWSALGSTDDLDSIEIPPTPAAPSAAPPPPAPQPQSAPTPQPPAPVPPAPTAAPQAPTQPEPQEPPPAVRLSPSDPLGIATALEQNRDASVAHLAQTRFALSEADIAELEENAAAFVPKMMARVHHEAQVSMMKFLAQAVPGMVQNFQKVTQANTQAEDQFFAAHQALGLDKSNPQHREVAFRMAKVYRMNNPQMSLEQLIADVGPMVALSLKLSPVPGVPGHPAATTSTPVPVGRPTGFRPAVNGGGGASPVPEPENEWAGLGRDYD